MEDHHFHRMGFTKDTDTCGNEDSRLTSITQEYLQRAKYPTHEYQKEEKQKRLNKIKTFKLNKVDSTITKMSNVLSNNNECVKQLCVFTGKEKYKQEYSGDATMDHFVKIILAITRSFINMKNLDYKIIIEIPNKGGLIKVKEGKLNIISIAYHGRIMLNYTKDNAIQVDKNIE